MNNKIKKVIYAFAKDIEDLAKSILSENDVGENDKTNENTLENSNLKNSFKAKIESYDEPVVISLFYSNYVEYIENGRRPKTGKFPPLDALHKWAVKRGIPTDNNILFLIARAIWRDGYEGRPILATLEEEIENRLEDKFYDELFESIITNLTKYFK